MNQAILAYMVEKIPDTFPICAAVQMPLGAQPFTVVPRGKGIAILAIADPKALPVHHPIFIIPAGDAVELPIGTRVGAFIGHLPMNGDTAFIFRAEPWPTAAVPGLPA